MDSYYVTNYTERTLHYDGTETSDYLGRELLQLNTGSIAAGKCADIIAMPGNPFDEITVTEKVNFVMKNGVVYRNDN